MKEFFDDSSGNGLRRNDIAHMDGTDCALMYCIRRCRECSADVSYGNINEGQPGSETAGGVKNES